MLHSAIAVDKTRIIPRSFGPRSIVLSVLLGAHPPQMSVGRILEFTSLFGIADGTVRTALSRMVSGGDLDNDDGHYRLTGRLLERQAQQDAGRARPPTSWDGSWWVAAVLAERRSVAERRAFRSQVVGARLGELRPDLWVRPANIAVPDDLADVMLTRGPLVTGDGEQLTRQLWDLGRIERDAIAHRQLLDDVGAGRGHDGTSWLADAFMVLADCQRFLRTEPQLPPALSTGTAANELRATYDLVLQDFQEDLATFFGRRRTEGPNAGSVSTTVP